MSGRGEVCNVVATGARDYYHVAIALEKQGKLGRLITDFYMPDWLGSIFVKRRSSELSSRRTLSLWPIAMLSKLITTPRNARLRRTLVDDAFGFIAAFLTFVGCNRAIVYSYNLVGFTAFYRLVCRRPAYLACFQVHPSPWFVNEILDADRRAFTGVRSIEFQPDLEASYSPSDLQTYVRSLQYCDAIICASSATVRSVADRVPHSTRIYTVPYGSKLAGAQGADDRSGQASTVKLVTVCQLTQRKGLHWAFEAFRSLPDDLRARFEWTIVSNKIDPAIEALATTEIRFRQSLADHELAQLVAEADLFVLPSLLEGFGLVYIEALSLGTPVLFTELTGAHDICADGIDGLRVRSSNVEDLVDIFIRLAREPDLVRRMRPAARACADRVTWNRFEAGIAAAIGDPLATVRP